MPDNPKISLTIITAIGAGVALIATVLPWYSFQVVLPVPPVVHVFSVTTTLWGLTTLAPTLIAAGAVVALMCAALGWRLADLVAALIGVGIAAYAIVRCFDIPHLGVGSIGALPAVTELEGGPFVAITAGAMLVAGAVSDFVVSAATERHSAFSRSRQPPGSSVRPPHAAA